MNLVHVEVVKNIKNVVENNSLRLPILGGLFLYKNKCLAEINIEKVKEIDMIFLYKNKKLCDPEKRRAYV